MHGGISWLLSAALLLGAAATTAAPLPCSSVSPEVREYVRQRGACRDVKPAPRPRAPTQPKSSNSDSRTSAPQELSVPDVTGLSDTDAARALAKFKVERIETPNSAPRGQVLEQEPAPATLGRPGSTVILQVSDGALAAAASTNPVPAPTTAATSSTPTPATDLAPVTVAAPMPPQEPAVPPAPREQTPTALSANAALIFGAGVLLGLLSGALLKRGRLTHREPVLLPPRQPPVDHRPLKSDAGSVAEPEKPPKIRFAVRFVPVETTIALASQPVAEEAISDSSDHHA